jgi:DNA-binding NtrC family response regulator
MTPGSDILAVIMDDDQASGESLRKYLKRQGLGVSYFPYPMQGISYLAVHPADVVFIDLRMPTMDGIEVLKQIKERHPHLMCVLMSGYATIDAAVEAMRFGAYDFLLKPFAKNYLNMVLQKIVEKISLTKELCELRSKSIQDSTAKMVGQSPPLLELRDKISRVAKSNATVLLLGESGTGKELVADALHALSPRHGQPLIKINCGAIPPNLVEAELFGFEKGAFTGAEQNKAGHFEMADKGTLFLDEVGELPWETQVKILRVLQDQSFQRLGSTHSRTVDVRIISATNKDLYQAIKLGKFREDLFYRLNVVPIHVPALRDRIEDIPLLIRFFLDKYCKTYNKPEKWLTPEALSELIRYRWPGNVRELQHLCEQWVLTCDKPWISEKELPGSVHVLKPRALELKLEVGITMRQATTRLMKETLVRTGGNVDEAAKLLNIHPKTIRRRIKEENFVEFLDPVLPE